MTLMKAASRVVAIAMLALTVAEAQSSTSVLFIGNSFLFGSGSAVRFYRAHSVTDLNGEGIGGVPALFKSFVDQAGLAYDVHLETRGGSGFEFHFENKLEVINQRPWDVVVMNGQSTLDLQKHGDPTKIVRTARQLSDAIHRRNPKVQIHLVATWSRADQTYPPTGSWFGKPIDVMARDVRTGNDKAAANAPAITSVIPVGEAWTRAMQTGVADPNPYDGIENGKLNLWTYDHYHASTPGYYLEALVIFGRLTGRDPRSLGENECSGYELGLARPQVKALQQVAFDQLAADGKMAAAPLVLPKPVNPDRCASPR
jgi:hypothetical protein